MKIVTFHRREIMEDQELKTKIRRILIKLDFRIDLSGFDYLVTAVALAIRDERYTKNLCEKLYPKVAELHETSASCVERSIRNAISKASISSGLKKINKAYGAMLITPYERPSVGRLIKVLVEVYNANLIGDMLRKQELDACE